MYAQVGIKQYRENKDGTDLVISISGMKLEIYSAERKFKTPRFGLMMAGIYLQSKEKKHTPRSGTLLIGQVICRKK